MDLVVFHVLTTTCGRSSTGLSQNHSTPTPSASMSAASKSSQTGSRFATKHSLLSTPLLCPRWQYHGAALRLARKAPIPTCCIPKGAGCRLIVLALEVGGRWSPEAAQFVHLLARCRARAGPREGRGARRLNTRDWSCSVPPSDPQHLCGSSCRKNAASRTPCCSAS